MNDSSGLLHILSGTGDGRVKHLDVLMAEYKEQCADWRMRDGYMETKFTRSAFVFSAISLVSSVFLAGGLDVEKYNPVAIFLVFFLSGLYTFVMLVSIVKDIYYRDGSMLAAARLLRCIEEHPDSQKRAARGMAEAFAFWLRESGVPDAEQARLLTLLESGVEDAVALVSSQLASPEAGLSAELQQQGAELLQAYLEPRCLMPSTCVDVNTFKERGCGDYRQHFLRKLKAKDRSFTGKWLRPVAIRCKTGRLIIIFYFIVLLLIGAVLVYLAPPAWNHISKADSTSMTVVLSVAALQGEGVESADLLYRILEPGEADDGAYTLPIIGRGDEPPLTKATHYIPAIVDEDGVVHVLCSEDGRVVHGEAEAVPESADAEPNDVSDPISPDD